MEDVATKTKGTADQKVMHKTAYKKAVSDLVTKRHANFGNIIEYNAYRDSIAKLRAIGKIVNPGAFCMAVYRSYWSSKGKVPTSSPISTSSLSSSLPSESTNNGNAAGLNARDIVCGNQDASTPIPQGLASSPGSATTLDESTNNDNAAGLKAIDISLSSSSFGSINNDDATRSTEEGVATDAVHDESEQTNNDRKVDRKRKHRQCIEQTTLDYAATLNTLCLVKGRSAQAKKGYLANLIKQ